MLLQALSVMDYPFGIMKIIVVLARFGVQGCEPSGDRRIADWRRGQSWLLACIVRIPALGNVLGDKRWITFLVRKGVRVTNSRVSANGHSLSEPLRENSRHDRFFVLVSFLFFHNGSKNKRRVKIRPFVCWNFFVYAVVENRQNGRKHFF